LAQLATGGGVGAGGGVVAGGGVGAGGGTGAGAGGGGVGEAGGAEPPPPQALTPKANTVANKGASQVARDLTVVSFFIKALSTKTQAAHST
jgi:hypothetical protein